jgi:polyhydroxyalkanoate synthesis regulator phasin
MTDEELVKALRDFAEDAYADLAADRIEALTAENERLERVVKDISDEADLAEQEACMVEDDFVKTEKEIEALTAKLAAAVEALREIAGECGCSTARAIIAEIEGSDAP